MDAFTAVAIAAVVLVVGIGCVVAFLKLVRRH
jgi:hypothetical protein